MQLTGTENFQCIGIVFDVNTASNEVSRRFFWHKGSLWENEYRTASRPMSISEVEQYLRENYSKEDYFSTSHNERFRRILYDSYLGGLDSEKFPLLFKRAIPFRMNIRLEDFVKEYICTEQNIHIEDMQESVMQYGRMQKKIEDTCEEIRQLKAMKEAFNEYDLLREKQEKYSNDTMNLILFILTIVSTVSAIYQIVDYVVDYRYQSAVKNSYSVIANVIAMIFIIVVFLVKRKKKEIILTKKW